jgi:hypothetical protein
MSIRYGLLSSLLLAASSIMSQPAVADWSVPGPTNGGAGVAQNIVIVVSENPSSNAERTCLAISLANAFSQNGFGYRLSNVTIFATLDGAALGVDKVVNNPRFKCAQQGGTEISLEENLDKFLAGNPNNLVLCPLCYKERFGDIVPPDNGFLPGPNSTAVIDIFANADKVISF